MAGVSAYVVRMPTNAVPTFPALCMCCGQPSAENTIDLDPDDLPFGNDETYNTNTRTLNVPVCELCLPALLRARRLYDSVIPVSAFSFFLAASVYYQRAGGSLATHTTWAALAVGVVYCARRLLSATFPDFYVRKEEGSKEYVFRHAACAEAFARHNHATVHHKNSYE